MTHLFVHHLIHPPLPFHLDVRRPIIHVGFADENPRHEPRGRRRALQAGPDPRLVDAAVPRLDGRVPEGAERVRVYSVWACLHW